MVLSAQLIVIPTLYIVKQKPFSYNNCSLISRISIKCFSKRSKIDYSKVPVLKESDLKEQFVHGSGPGGQKVNKSSNCVVLKHLPTGIVVKNHEDRDLNRNRKLARKLLITKLDNLINGDESVSAQKHKLLMESYHKREKKAKKLRELKKNFKITIDNV